MSRGLKKKISVVAKMEAQTSLSVGGVGGSETADLELAQNGKGEWYIPGTSVTGPLRSWLETHFERGGAIAAALFGYQNRKTGKGQASFLSVGDAPLHVLPGLGREVRDGIRIDGATGTTKKGFKYNRAVLPAGTTASLRLELDLPPKPVEVRRELASEKETVRLEELEAALREMLQALTRGEIRFGAAKGRGLGKMQGKDLQIFVYDFPKDLDLWLEDKPGQELALKCLGSEETLVPQEFLREEIVVAWEPISPTMVKSGRDGTKADMVPLVSGVGPGGVAPVLPGSSLKGILRGRAEKIVRTLLLKDARDPAKEAACLEIVRELFGDEDRGGRICIDDVYQRGNVSTLLAWFGEQDDFEKATEYAQHVAVDRFTGGASEGALYSIRTPKMGPQWDPIRMVVDFSRPVKVSRSQEVSAAGENDRDPASEKTSYAPVSVAYRDAMRALLYLTLLDLKDGLLPLGFGTNRGMGEIRILGGIKGYDEGKKEALLRAWKAFLKNGGNPA